MPIECLLFRNEFTEQTEDKETVRTSMTKVDKSDERLFDRIKEDWTRRYSDFRQRLQ